VDSLEFLASQTSKQNITGEVHARPIFFDQIANDSQIHR